MSLQDMANQCDIHYRFAQNKRLHVEIALMKMAYSPYAISMDQPITEKSRSAGENDKKKALREEANSYVEKKSKSDTATSPQDRKSTRLNSSHVANSYAVFCLKKKTKTDR